MTKEEQQGLLFKIQDYLLIASRSIKLLRTYQDGESVFSDFELEYQDGKIIEITVKGKSIR